MNDKIFIFSSMGWLRVHSDEPSRIFQALGSSDPLDKVLSLFPKDIEARIHVFLHSPCDTSRVRDQGGILVDLLLREITGATWLCGKFFYHNRYTNKGACEEKCLEASQSFLDVSTGKTSCFCNVDKRRS